MNMAQVEEPPSFRNTFQSQKPLEVPTQPAKLYSGMMSFAQVKAEMAQQILTEHLLNLRSFPGLGNIVENPVPALMGLSV